MQSPGFRVTVVESLNCDHCKVSEWCDLWWMKLNAGRSKTMIISRSCTMHPQSPALTNGKTALKSDDLNTLGVTFGSKMTFDRESFSLSFQSSFSKIWYLEEVLSSFP